MSVNDRNTTSPIRNAYFSVTHWNNGDGNYYVYVRQGELFWCDADGYKVAYQYAEPQMRISLGEAIWPDK